MNSTFTEPTRVREWRWRLVLVFAAISGVSFVTATIVIAVQYSFQLPYELVGLATVLALLSALAYLLRQSGIREIQTSMRGVEFRLGNDLIQVKWDELRPPKYPLFLGDIDFYFPDAMGPVGAAEADRGRVAVTKRQALLILEDLRCPKWELPANIRRSLGL